MNRRALSFVFSMIAMSLVASVDAAACTCGQSDRQTKLSEMVRDERSVSDAVFTGKVLGLAENQEDAYTAVELEVFDAWKGKPPRKVTILTGLHDGNCRYYFVVGQTYLVYARTSSIYKPTSLSTGICSRTRLHSQAKADIKVLGKPTARRKDSAK